MLANLDSSDNQKSEARIKTMHYLIESCCTCFKLLTETLLEKTKPTVLEIFEIENRQSQHDSKGFYSWDCPDFDAK